MQKGVVISDIDGYALYRILLVLGITLTMLSFSISSANGAYQEIAVSCISSEYTLTARNASAANDSEGYIYVVWDDYSASEGKRNIYASFSSDNGANWSASDRDEVVSHNKYDAKQPDIYVENRLSVHMVWSELNETSKNFEIKYARYRYEGFWNISNEKYITVLSGEVKDCELPQIVVDGRGGIHAVWRAYNSTSNLWEIYYGKSTDGGKTWSSEKYDIKISDPSITSDSYSPTLIIDSKNYIWVFYIADTVIYYSLSQDLGDSWTYGKVAAYPTDTHLGNLTSVFFNGWLFVFWELCDPSTIKHTEITVSYFDYSSGWSDPKIISYQNDEYGAYHPSAAASKNAIYVVWSQNDSRYVQLYYSYSSDGISWSGENGNYPLTDSDSNHDNPCAICTPNNDLHVFWDMWTEHTKQRGSREVFTLNVPGGNVAELFTMKLR